MKFKNGDEVNLKFERDERLFKTIIRNFDEENALFELKENVEFSVGDSIVITKDEEEFYGNVKKVDSNLVCVRWSWEKSRKFFRVDDVIQVACKKIDLNKIYRSRIFYGASSFCAINLEEEYYGINPHILKLLKSIDDKLTIILEKLEMDREGFNKIGFQHVNISASGIRFKTKEDCNVGDRVEVKMLLPTVPVTGIVTYGEVIKVRNIDKEKEIAVNFLDLEEDICDEIVQYTLKRQKEILRKQKSQVYE